MNQTAPPLPPRKNTQTTRETLTHGALAVKILVRPVIFLGSLLFLLNGCFRLGSPTPAARLYRLEAPAHLAASTPKKLSGKGPVLMVSAAGAASEYDTAAMAYMRSRHQIEYFTHSRWLDKPARLLQTALVRELNEHPALEAALAAPSAAQADYLINLTLLELYQDFLPPESARLIFSCQLEIIDHRGKLVGSRVFQESEAATPPDAVGGVAAANRILSRLLPRLAAFCAQSVQQ
ncbi:MAG TPA: hypothetical protein ENN66_09660 [Proteobacteria bacterium]|nr:hypothetical protein [Pseudomonadota bacterium]